MSDELKPCPFCGAHGVLEQRAALWVVSCVGRFVDCPVNMRTHKMREPEEAIAAWNQRAK